MSVFTALNIIPDDDSDDDIDNTKEIQIEEALKLYQAALRLHSKCPATIDETYKAYIALFNSEIFRYPESLPYLDREDEPELDQEFQHDFQGEERASGARRPIAGAAMNADGIPSTLPQILHLAYKNRGQFGLDFLNFHMQRWREEAVAEGVDRPIPKTEMVQAVATSLQFFSEALVRDDTDSELWRRASRIAAALGNERIARFCLEAVVAQEDVNLDGGLGALKVEEAMAGHELRELLHHLEDSASLCQPAIADLKYKRLALTLRTGLDLYPYLPHLIHTRGTDQANVAPFNVVPARQTVCVSVPTWAAVGKALLQLIAAERLGTLSLIPGTGITLECPDADWNVPSEHQTSESKDRGAEWKVPSEEPMNGSQHRDGEQMTNASMEDVASPTRVIVDLTKDEDGKATASVKPPPANTSLNQDETTSKDVKRQDSGARKRNISRAGSPDVPDGGRVRSKRIRARESFADPSTNEEEVAQLLARQIAEDHIRYAEVDQRLSLVVGHVLSELNVDTIGDLDALKRQAPEGHGTLHQAITDLLAILKDVLDGKSNPEDYSALIGPGVLAQMNEMVSSRDAGLTNFLEHAKSGPSTSDKTEQFDDALGLDTFARTVNQQWLQLKQTAFEWLTCLLSRARNHSTEEDISSYMHSRWKLPLKEAVVQLLIALDGMIYDHFREELYALEGRGLQDQARSARLHGSSSHLDTLDMAQTIFEIHLDVYERIINPSSEVRINTRIEQKDRLERWQSLVGDLINTCLGGGDDERISDPLALRFIWASTTYISCSPGVSRDHVVVLVNGLKETIDEAGSPTIKIPNNIIMPEVSREAADKEISRLTTMDFFLSIFQNDGLAPPLHIIETLEPVLDPPAIERGDTGERASTLVEELGDAPEDGPSPDLTKFIATASVSLRLLLWKRLQEAYTAIDYTPKVMSCYLRSIEVIIHELETSNFSKLAPASRHASLSIWIATLDDLVIRALTLAVNVKIAFDSIDEAHVATSLTAVGKLCRLLHGFTTCEDTFRIESARILPRLSSPAKESFILLASNFHEKQTRAWSLFYCMIREALKQHRGECLRTTEDLLLTLRAIHAAVGVRDFCDASNRIFLKLFKLELLKAGPTGDFAPDLAQVLFDLHGLRLGVMKDLVESHGCIADTLDKRTATYIIDYVMGLVRRVNAKDLNKSEYKTALDMIQQAISTPKYTHGMLHNMRNIKSYMLSPINPLILYRSLKGMHSLATLHAGPESAKVADKGWYVLLGNMALSRFRSQKRSSQGPTDDLELAGYYFKLDLHYGTDRWQSWYSLATINDLLVEEASLWTAEKLNGDRPGLDVLQRQAINCYTMAVSSAANVIEPSPADLIIMSNLFADFGTRIYASSRAPYSMTTFWLDDFERHYSGAQQMYKKPPHAELTVFKAWSYARGLFQKALVQKPEQWKNHYMMGNCLWKMLNHENNVVRDGIALVKPGDVIYALTRAIETLPERRSDRGDPILEPHYKLVSVVHKMIKQSCLEPERGSNILQATRYSRRVPPARDIEEWEPYILQVLKNLRTADKANWHHRMTARAAHVLYNEVTDDLVAAAAARHELSQQIFTKTMAVQVWKPEYERAGRHFVYTSRYVQFFTQLLLKLNDRASMEGLVRRVGKRLMSFYDHTRTWTLLVGAYIVVLRRAGQIAMRHEEVVFKSLPHEDILRNAERLETWCHERLPPITSNVPVLGVLCDAMELKKLNQKIMKETEFDDLIVDSYARLYETVVSSFPALPPTTVSTSDDAKGKADPTNHDPPKMSIDNILGSSETRPSTDPTPTAIRPASTAIPRTRITKGINRRDLLKLAEAVATKPAAIPTPVASEKHGSRTRRSASQQRQWQHQHKRGEEASASDAKDPLDPIVLGSSPLPSLHDSDSDADETESDEERPKPLFPNLARSHSIAIVPRRAAETDDEAEGNDGDDEDMGEEDGADDEDDAQETNEVSGATIGVSAENFGDTDTAPQID